MFRKFALTWVLITLSLAVIMFGCGDEGEGPIGVTDDPGDVLSTDWEVTAQTSGIEGTLQEVFFDSASSNGWIVGNDGVILHTTDKGETWEQQDSGTANTLYSVYFVDENEGWVVGDAGIVLHTADSGSSWETQNSGISEQLRGLFFSNSSEGWAVGKAGVIISTRDGGTQWNPQDSRTNQDLEAIDFAPPPPGEVVVDHGWIVGLNATIRRTTDGTTWTQQDAPRGITSEPLYGIFFSTESKGWAAGKLGPSIINSSNGGQTWGNSAAVDAGNNRIYDLFFLNAANGWAVGSGGTILHSPDGGAWKGVKTEVTKTITTPLWGVAFIDTSEGWAVGDLGVILHIESAQ